MTPFADRLAILAPPIALFVGACISVILGQSRDRDIRRAVPWVAGLCLFIAYATVSPRSTVGSPLPWLAGYITPAIAAVGLLLLAGIGNTDRRLDERLARGEAFDALRTTRGETAAFVLLSLTGAMLTAMATDLIWLFLALELTSLPTYIMVATGRSASGEAAGQEAGVKYFFLGALAAATFLFGFALMYGASGSLRLEDIRAAFAAQVEHDGSLNPLATLGVIVAVIGVAFKIAAVPMHFYVADVYEGAAAPVSAFLAFVPKTAGFVSIMLLTSTVVGMGGGDSTSAWPAPVHAVLWVIAALTMMVGNTLALLQTSAKRMLAYSSIAHSGYMLIGIVAGPGLMGGSEADNPSSNGFAAVLFYLVAYGVMNLGAFLVLACLEGGDDEISRLDDLAGLHRDHPGLSIVLSLCALALLGLPPLVGFFGKLYLFSAGIGAREYVLVVFAGLNSAAGAWYYLRLAGLPWLAKPAPDAVKLSPTPYSSRRIAAALAAAGVLVMVLAGSPIIRASNRAATMSDPHSSVNEARAEGGE